ncbi:MAG: hypothetical protein U5N86_07380 [Planctomycetota bacterium]|nr:hypothetical protein [Planctomycetota bacterium]
MYKKIFTTALFAFASAVFLFSLCPAEEAESITVGEGGKFRKLTEALETAQDGDEIVFLPA